MRPYRKEDIVAIYKRLIKIACEYADKNEWEKASSYLSSSAQWAYQFNLFYTDDAAESLIRRISDSQVSHTHVMNPEENRIVLVDSFCMDNRGLTQQYLRGMIRKNAEILYVCTSRTTSYGKDILREIDSYPKARVLLFEGSETGSLSKVNDAAREICQFAPAHIFFHIAPWDVAALLICNVISGVPKYNINLTDHAYWMGASLIDFNIEFRPYGMTVSLEKRGLKPEQLLTLPFYPITPLGHSFRGFPDMPDNAIKVLTGGALYKMLGKGDFFFHLMEDLLSISPDVYILVAGFSHNLLFEKKCSGIKGNERILQIGFRDDIDAVFQNCDVFLSTYPVSGGLMCQYAAKYGKPVLAYREMQDCEGAIEEMLNHYDNKARSFTDMNDLLKYAGALFADKEYRRREGEALKNGLMTPDQFYNSFSDLMSSHCQQWKWNRDVIDYEAFFEHYLELENENGFEATKTLFVEHRFDLLTKMDGYRGFLLGRVIEFSAKRLVKIVRSRLSGSAD